MLKRFLVFIFTFIIYMTILGISLTTDKSSIYNEIFIGSVPNMVSVVEKDVDNNSNSDLLSCLFYPSFYLYYGNKSYNFDKKNTITIDSSSPLYIYDKVPPFVVIKLHKDFSDSEFNLEIPVKRSFGSFAKWPYTNIPIVKEPLYFAPDTAIPENSYIKIVFKNNYLIFGRTKIRWGYWPYPVSISDNCPFYDNITYIYTSSDFSFYYHVISENPIANSMKSKLVVSHRIDLKILKNLIISIGELSLISINSQEDLLFLTNPFGIWHNNFVPGTNSLGSLQISWTPLKSINLYLDFALDEFVIPYSESPNSNPNTYAISIGMYKALTWFNKPVLVNFNYSHTTEWMYNHKNPDLLYDCKIIRISDYPVRVVTYHRYPIGFLYGPDAYLYSFSIDIIKKLHLNFALLRKNLNISLETKYLSSSSKNYKNYLIFDIGAVLSNNTSLGISIINNFIYLYTSFFHSI